MLTEILTNPVAWVVLLVAVIVTAHLADRAARKPQEPPLTKEPTPFAVPKVDPLPEVTADDPIRPHLFELIATTINGGAIMRIWNLRADTQVIGNWRITVEKIED